MRRIVNTRPLHQSTALTNALHEHQWQVFSMPALSIKALDFVMPNTFFDVAIFVSANAVFHFFKAGNSLHAKTILAIGPATQAALSQHVDQSIVLPLHFSSEALLALDCLQQVQQQKIMIVCGRDSKPLLNNTLRERGATVSEVVCYERCDEIIKEEYFIRLIDQQINTIVITSMESQRVFLSQLNKTSEAVQTFFCAQQWCLINHVMAEQIRMHGIKDVILAANATDHAIVQALLQNRLPEVF